MSDYDPYEVALQQENQELREQLRHAHARLDGRVTRAWQHDGRECSLDERISIVLGALGSSIEGLEDKARVATRERDEARKERDAAEDQCAAAERGHNEASVMLERVANAARDILVRLPTASEMRDALDHALADYDASIDTNAPPPRADTPAYNAGRSEGRADVAAQLRNILDPNDVEHLNLDGLLAWVSRLSAPPPVDWEKRAKAAEAVVEAARAAAQVMHGMTNDEVPAGFVTAEIDLDHALAAYDSVKT